MCLGLTRRILRSSHACIALVLLAVTHVALYGVDAEGYGLHQSAGGDGGMYPTNDVSVSGQWLTPSPKENPVNLALGKKTRQSSDYRPGSYLSNIAVDGVLDGHAPHITHTRNEKSPYWEVDLGETFVVNNVLILNRADCCQERLSHFYVVVSLFPLPDTNDVVSVTKNGLVWSAYIEKVGAKIVIPVPKVEGRYVRIMLTANNFLSLGQVQVFGPTEEHLHSMPLEPWVRSVDCSWKIFMHDDFETGASSWSQQTVTSCSLNKLLGGFGSNGGNNQGELKTSLSGFPPHSQIRVRANIFYLDNWQDESAILKVDGKVVWSEKCYMCGQRGQNFCGNGKYHDTLGHSIDIIVDHWHSSLALEFGSTLKGPTTEHSFGITNLHVHYFDCKPQSRIEQPVLPTESSRQRYKGLA